MTQAPKDPTLTSMDPRHPHGFPVPARAERIADWAVQGTGLLLAVAGAALLTTFAALYLAADRVAALSVYAGALVLTFLASVLYHALPWGRLRPALRRLDHAAIYLKIAGTYTPLVALAGGAFAWGLLLVVWLLALGGAALRLLRGGDPGRLGVWLYLVLGWLGVLVAWPLASAAPLATLLLVGLGGLLYTLGVPFFAARRLRYSTAIWHGFVLLASGCFFAAIAVGSFSA